MSIKEMKERFIDGSLDKGMFRYKNESNEDAVLVVSDNQFSIQTFQHNGWIRINIYSYDGDIWTDEEIYELP